MKTLKKDFQRIVETKNLNTEEKIVKYLLGKEIVIIDNKNSHSYGPIGQKLVFDNPNMAVRGPIVDIGRYKKNIIFRGTSKGNNILFTDFSIVNNQFTLEEIEEEISSLKKEKKITNEKFDNELFALKTKIDYLKESGAEKFDEIEFKVYSTLKTIENNNLSTLERTKVISNLINS